jgi:hypothetical protein
VSLITEALELQTRKKPRASEALDLPPFSRRPWILKAVAWILGIVAAVVLGVWQGETLWHFVQKTTGFQAAWTSPSPSEKKATSGAGTEIPEAKVTEQAPAPAVIAKSIPERVSNLLQVRSDLAPAGLPTAVNVALQNPDTDDLAEAEKTRYRRESAVRKLELQGVRMQGSESRALIHGAPIGLGESVGVEGLKLKAIEAGPVIFEDPNGIEFFKSY